MTKNGRILEWFEKDFKPVLCWVSDCSKTHNSKDTAIIVSYNKDDKWNSPFYTWNNSYAWAQPLTKKELLKYCLEEQNEFLWNKI